MQSSKRLLFICFTFSLKSTVSWFSGMQSLIVEVWRLINLLLLLGWRHHCDSAGKQCTRGVSEACLSPFYVPVSLPRCTDLRRVTHHDKSVSTSVCTCDSLNAAKHIIIIIMQFYHSFYSHHWYWYLHKYMNSLMSLFFIILISGKIYFLDSFFLSI